MTSGDSFNTEPTAPEQQQGQDDILNVIADVESQLQALRQTASDRKLASDKLSERERELDQKERDVLFQLEQLQGEKEDLGLRQSELQEQLRSVEATQATITEDQARLQALGAELEGRARELESARTNLDERAALLDEVESDLEARQANEARFEAVRASLTSERDEALQRIEALEASIAEGERARDELQASLESRTMDLDALREEATRLASLEQDHDTLLEQSQSLREEYASLQQELQVLRETLLAKDEQIERLDAELGSIRDDRDSKVQSLESSLQEARSRFDDEFQQATSALEEELASLREHAGRADQENEQLRRQVHLAAEKLRELAAAVEEERTAAQQAMQQVALLEKRGTDLEDQITRLKEQGGGRPDDFNESRRARLRRVRTLVRAQEEKVARASDLLRQRFEQLDELLAQRGEVVKASKNLKAKQKRLVASQSRMRTVWTLVGMLIILLAVGAVSWVVAGQVQPGTYAANVVIVPASNRKLTAGELRAWQEFHESMLMDPQFVEIACERLKRRGITTLGTPGLLLEYLENNLSFQSPAPGRLEVEIRGEGPMRTERILDTYAVTLAGEANRARISRTDGAGTQLEAAAKAQSLPLDSQRLAMTGMIFAGAGSLFLFMGTIGYARLVRVKNEFEKRGELDMILDEANWVDPRSL